MPKSKSSLSVDKTSSWQITSSPSLPNAALQRKKSLTKIMGSPIKKRKTGGQNGPTKKVNGGKRPDFQNKATAGDYRWTTDLPKTQKYGKVKKQSWKNDGKSGRIYPQTLPNIKNMVSSNRPRSASFSESSCCKEVSLWQRCTSFSSALVGKAR